MNTAELTALLDRLRAEARETEWLEFKANRHEPQVLGEYLSALYGNGYYRWTHVFTHFNTLCYYCHVFVPGKKEKSQ